ncbi:hypothetical protein [Phenylobacterium sp.]|uniref:hypothetical protein n=1 Tax=Phenylobacterium sp. TaxID=1871053 RepID=UPI001219F044|nr:hypothetical protein [Phenylobacterium sp.]THD67128.1 MAG: hypothetical protein E8A12_05500 [Phenylobacterium sp.]
MIRNLAQLAYRLDEWLQTKLGRPYNALLGVGLVLGLIHQFQDLPKDFARGGGVSTLLIAAMDVALLVNQAGQFHQHLERRRTMPKRLKRRAGKDVAKAEGDKA